MKRSLLTLTLLASCSSPKQDQPPAPFQREPEALPSEKAMASAMTVSDRCTAVRDLMVDTIVHGLIAPAYPAYGGSYNQGVPAMDAEAMPEPRDQAKMADKSEASQRASSGSSSTPTTAPTHYTTTNVQEKGVDEADLVKTDGKFIYTIRNNELVIAKTWPVKDTELSARVSFTNLTAQQLYLRGSSVIVQGVANDTGKTRVAVIDVSDREAPKLDRTFDIDGQTASSRVVGDDLYLVQQAVLQPPQKLYELAQQELAKIPRADQQTLRPWEVQSRIANSLREKLLANLSPADIQAALPKITRNGASQTMQCKDLYVPQTNMQLGMTALARISIDNQRADLVGAMVSGGQVYASTESIYVTGPGYVWNQQGYASQSTAVHEFSLAANDGRPTYVATGVVPGTVLNQFSMSEYQGNLRIATTDDHLENHIFVLRASDKQLKTIGQLDGIAKGERIYSGRMFGDKGYLVTFRQTDPLFTLDLSNPRKPKIAGELKINGFSNYIHPMGGDLLLAIGQDATDAGQQTGFQMQVFDVSNPANPTRRFHEKLSSWSSYSSSMAQGDHHAFTFDPVTGTLALPVAGSTSEGEQFNGLVVYTIDRKTGFVLNGRVTHRKLAAETLDAMCDKQGGGDDPWNQDVTACNQSQRQYLIPQYSQIDRSIVVDNYLITLGTAGMEIHQTDKLATRLARMRWPVSADHAQLVVSAE
jgi:inhibitor of cysteine peptidase